MSDLAHLAPLAREVMQKSESERIHFAGKDHWIDYPIAGAILREMKYLLNAPRTRRMINLLIVGESNSGKSAILDRFYDLNPSVLNDTEKQLLPIVRIDAPSAANPNRLYDEILNAIFAPFDYRDRLAQKVHQTREVMAYCGTRMLIIDELHQLISGSPAQQRIIAGELRDIGNSLKIPIVFAGTRLAARYIAADVQLSNRCMPARLPRWKLNRDFRSLVMAFETFLPLPKPSGLGDKHLLEDIHAMSEGLLGEVKNILTRAAALAIGDGAETIVPEHLKAIGWVRPSDRQRDA